MTDGLCVAAFFSGLLGAMGFGGGSVLIIYLTLFLEMQQKEAQGINLIFFIPCALISVIMNRKNHLVKLKTGAYVILGGFVGVALGSYLVSKTEPVLLGKLFGGFVVLMGVITLFSKSGVKEK